MSWGNYLLLLALTLAIELGIIEGIRRLSPPAPRRVDVLWANLGTHPLANVAISLLGWPFLPIELLVVGTEAIAFRWLNPALSWRRACAIALIANAVTALLSLAT